MRHPFLSACLAALCAALATPSPAQEAPDCGMMCRITGYLSTDHMAAVPSGAAADDTAKPRKAKSAASHKAIAAKAGAAPTPTIAKAAKHASATLATIKPSKPVTVAKGPAPALAQAPEPVRAKVASARPTPKPVAQPALGGAARRPKPAQVAAVEQPAAAKPAHRAPRVAARPAPHTLTASAFIPGSAPAVPAGFQPFH